MNEQLINLLLSIICIIGIGVTSGLASAFVLFCMGNPDNGLDHMNLRMIFSSLGLKIATKYEEFEQRLEKEVGSFCSEDNARKYVAMRINIWKALGACRYCFNFWITMIVTLIFCFFQEASFWFLLFTPCFSYYVLLYVSDRY